MRSLAAIDELVAQSGAQRRPIAADDWSRYERYVGEILGSLGLDLSNSSTVDTPRRFLRALYDATDGYDGDPKLLTAFPTECRGGANCELAQVVEGPIPFSGICEHHALPFTGRAWIGSSARAPRSTPAPWPIHRSRSASSRGRRG